MFRHALVFAATVSTFMSTTAFGADPVDFEKQILPIFMEHCAGCHGEEKGAGKLKLHTVKAIQEGLTVHKHLLVAGKPDESELVQRLVLPADDKKRMPKKADPLPKEKIDLIRLWIEQGATAIIVAAVADAPAAEMPKEIPLPEVGAASEESLGKLTAAGAQVLPLFADSSLLQVSFALGSEPATDENVALLAEVAEQVYSLNLAGAKATDAGLGTLAQLKNLSHLHLENSVVTDAGMTHLAQLASLQYLNLYGTGITDAGLASLEGLPNLRKLYLWQTKVSYDVAMALEQKIPGLKVNLGFDHPVVVKKRLTKELARTSKQIEESTADEEKLAKQLEEVKKQKEAVQKRVEEINKELAALDGKPEAEKPAEEAKPAEGEKPAEEKKEEEKKEEPKKEEPKKEEPKKEEPKKEEAKK